MSYGNARVVSQAGQLGFTAGQFGANLFGCQMPGWVGSKNGFLPVDTNINANIVCPVANSALPESFGFIGIENSYVQAPVVPSEVAQKGMPVVSFFSKNIYQCYPSISSTFAPTESIEKALELFESALKIDLEDDMRNAELKLHVASSLAKTGFSQRAMEVYNELLVMLDSYEAEDTQNKSSSLGLLSLRTSFRIKVAESLAQEGFTVRAMDVVDDLLIKLDAHATKVAEDLMMSKEELLSCPRGWPLAYGQLRFRLAKIMMQAGLAERAMKILNELLEYEVPDLFGEFDSDPLSQFPTAQIRIKFGEAIAQAGLYDEALAVDTGDSAGNTELKLSIGKIMIGAGKLDEALDVDTGFDLDNIELILAVGEAKAQRGDTEKALELFEEAMTRTRIASQSSSYKQVELRTAIGIAFEQAGYGDRALEVLEGTLDIISEDAIARSRRKDPMGKQDYAYYKKCASEAWEKLKVAKAMIQAGFTVHAEDVLDQVLLITVEDTEQSKMLKLSVGQALAEAEIFEKALDVDTGDLKANIILKTAIGSSMLKAGSTLRALKLFDNMVMVLDENSVRNKHRYKLTIVEALLEEGMFDKAQSIADAERANVGMKKAIGIAKAKAGVFQEAFSIETGNSRPTAEMRQFVIETMVNAVVATFINASRSDAGVA